jgi:N-acetylglucosaminyldiphosphoundecaprenol N-acetyl-beta-D-mannosaminyltransferase
LFVEYSKILGRLFWNWWMVVSERGLQRHDWRNGQTLSRSLSPSIDQTDDLSRNVFGVLGMPLDAVDFQTLLSLIDGAVKLRRPFLLSTPNVNFLMMSRVNDDFRESLLMSDLCPVDGMPMVWIARLLGIPIGHRLSGSDIFDALRSRDLAQKLKVFMFGGSEGIVDSVSKSINAEQGGLTCVGTLNPGFGSVAEMSTDAIFQSINASNADLLTLFLSAGKAQAWLLRNHARVEIPFRAQFGATINLQAGRIRRAPLWVQRMGLEWLWRIKEEPYLWRRYWVDGRGLLTLVVTCVLPLSVGQIFRRLAGVGKNDILTIDQSEGPETLGIRLSGAAVIRHIDAATACFRQALEIRKPIVIDLSQVSTIDQRFFGLLLMLRKQLLARGDRLTFSGVKRRSRKLFRMNGFGFLLIPEPLRRTAPIEQS